MVLRIAIILSILAVVLFSQERIAVTDTLKIYSNGEGLETSKNDTISLFQVEDDQIELGDGFDQAPMGVESDAFKNRVDGKGISLLTFQNPFNLETIIQFELEKRSSVKIDVYDIYGIVTKNLINGILKEGEHLIKFDSRNLNNGTYLIKFIVDGKGVDLKKIVLMD